VVLADPNILSTFAKIGELSLLVRLFAEEGIGVVPAVYEELGILRALWRTHLLTKEQVRSLVTQIEAKDRIVFRDQEQIFVE
jgi:predicted nucleic acid-binding protein